jgi:hypothetical protein
MSTNRVRMDLRYTVIFDRAPGEYWPRLKVASDYQAEVTQVAVEVTYEDGQLEAQTPDITAGRRIRRDGTLGRSVGTSHGYYSFWERDDGQAEIEAQSQWFRDQALEAAEAEHAKLAVGFLAPALRERGAQS